ncbi:respiratory chain complex I subunit 1 family protein [Thermococcus thioreducens]|uniref:CO-induced hydrogenase subunit K n=1 Tax=Thermococcus thioreducens TaxID=277988 RepID=A0A0Q2UMC4_9EURY|nr:respiratory chain complex I subunit 1 family protein [Thermococcus thioreducens]ASJ13427.1 CO-induced hydrogenase subunit K [Thermococcus thioreducens]KQH81784.1 CO-induced hydrogenase subunit K [Thermococcus thioreducens]SEW24361.1 Membrane bound hydrogenase subunit mbhM [Thermococcus thioreducens]
MNLLYATLGFVGIYIYVSLASLLWGGIDRKLVARMQRRIGPPLLQPFYDFLKLVSKESIIPRDANRFFELAPVMALATSIALLAYTPLGFEPIFGTKGDVIVFIYLLTLIGFLRVVGAVSSGSPYAQIGAQREMALLASREAPMMLALFVILWRLSELGVTKPFSMGTFYEHSIWELGTPLSLIGAFILLIVFLAWLASEIEVGYFNIPEAETELAEGPMAEYSGRHLAIFELANAIKAFVSASLVVAIFFPWGISGYLGLTGVPAMVVELLFHTLKVFGVLLVSMSIFRAITGRLRINQAVNMFWTRLLPASVLGALLLAIDTLGVIA